MSLSGIFMFALIFAVACASPGPTVTSVVARVVGRGAAGMPWFCAGLVLGDIVWLAAAVFGLAALAAVFQPVFLVIRYLGAAYLLWLAWRLWWAPAKPKADATPPQRGERLRLMAGGLALALGNPKTMLFYLALVPTLLPLAALHAGGFLAVVGVVTLVYSMVLTGYILSAASARRLFAHARIVRDIQRVSALVMAGAAVAVVAKRA